MATAGSASRFYVEYDAWLVEEAVFLRMRGHPEEATFRLARDPIYRVTEPEEQEKQFREFHGRWFSRLKLGHPLTAALEEQPAIVQQIRRCYVAPAASAKEVGADLHQAQASQSPPVEPDRIILLRLRPESFLDPSLLQQVLQHELLHVADMLDPRFGYEPQLPPSEAGPVYDNLIRDRYRVLWNTWVDGRLSRRGWAPDGIFEKRLAEFAATFSVSQEQAREEFQKLFDSDSQTHSGLMALAGNPQIRIDPLHTSSSGPQICPLCRCPTYLLLDLVSEVPDEVRDEVVLDFPAWRPEQGLCCQCADLYRARDLSRAAQAALPRI